MSTARERATEYAQGHMAAVDFDDALIGALARGFHDGMVSLQSDLADAEAGRDAAVAALTRIRETLDDFRVADSNLRVRIRQVVGGNAGFAAAGVADTTEANR